MMIEFGTAFMDEFRGLTRRLDSLADEGMYLVRRWPDTPNRYPTAWLGDVRYLLGRVHTLIDGMRDDDGR